MDYSPFITDKLPVDAEGFTKSFSIDHFDAKEVTKFYHKYGILVFDDVLDQKEVEKSVKDLWKDEAVETEGKVKVDDPETWKYVGGKLGFVNFKPIVQSQLCKNRSHPKVYKAFKTLYELSSN